MNKTRAVVIIIIVVIVAAAAHHQRSVRRQRLRDAIGMMAANRNSENGGDASSAQPAAPVPAAASEACKPNAVGYQILTIKGRPVALWYPTTAPPIPFFYSANFSGDVALNAPPSMPCGKPVPLVVFSHGDAGCGLQSAVFTEELARHGYVVAAPDHADAALCHTAEPAGPRSPRPRQLNFFKPETWNETSFTDRRDDIEAVISEVLANRELQPIIEPQNIGAAGHSLGGYTVVGMAGGWPSWREPRIRAVLALSPYVMPFQVKKTLGDVRVPLMYQGGTLDVGITPFLKGPNGAYAQANPPAYFAILKEAAHLAWANCGKEDTTESCVRENPNARLIVEYGVAFFDRYLKNIPEPVLEQENPALAEYEFKLAER